MIFPRSDTTHLQFHRLLRFGAGMKTSPPDDPLSNDPAVNHRIDGIVDRSRHPVAWAVFVQQLEDARDHLQDLISSIENESEFGEIELQIHLGHVYAHLNRAWHWRGRCSDEPPTEEDFDLASQFPDDVLPT